jgi:hypothetical protein
MDEEAGCVMAAKTEKPGSLIISFLLSIVEAVDASREKDEKRHGSGSGIQAL